MSPFRFVQWVTEGRNVVIYGDGTQTRDFTYIDDIARGTMQCLNLSGFNIVNLGSDTPNELREALGIIEGLLGKKARIEQRPFPNADVAATWADISRARESLGWVPRTDLREGLTRLVQWYLENRTWASGIETGD
jgi:nucleoside-diphosphate-sugar epimerase